MEILHVSLNDNMLDKILPSRVSVSGAQGDEWPTKKGEKHRAGRQENFVIAASLSLFYFALPFFHAALQLTGRG